MNYRSLVPTKLLCMTLFLAFAGSATSFAQCSNPVGAAADQFFNTTYNRMQYCDGTNWINMGVSSLGATDNLGDHIATQILRSDTHNTDDLGTAAIRWKDGWFAGAVTAGSFAGVGTNLTALNASNLASGTVPTARLGTGTANATTYLRGDGQWVAVSTGLPALTSANLWVGNGTNVATAVTLSGDATLTNAGVLTIGSNAVGSAEITDATITGTDIAGTTITGANIANTTITVGKLSATGTANNTTFLRGDGQWAAPGGGGGASCRICRLDQDDGFENWVCSDYSSGNSNQSLVIGTGGQLATISIQCQ